MENVIVRIHKFALSLGFKLEISTILRFEQSRKMVSSDDCRNKQTKQFRRFCHVMTLFVNLWDA